MDAFRATVRRLASKYLGKPLKEIEISGVVQDLVQGAIQHEIDIPTELSLVGKALMTIEGIGKELHPDLDIWEEARPYLLDLVMKRYHPLRLGNELWRGMSQLSSAARNMPLQINDILDDLRRGELTLRTRDPELPRLVDRLGRRVLSGLVAVGLLGAGTALLIGAPQLRALAYGFLAGAALIFLGHLVRDAFRGEKPPDPRR
jgi:ubiquinone biosynthesis protein